ncbi:stage III sporulation protein AE [Dorea sp. AF36-15AT]|uniref:stage III sporulation protein AE n=1 Tax=Dorea sp. AF36-15AT TaxID=2292041 RepID=UPI000E522EDE|nr:stage III sporulation protein AE [Dorea sp. AF36-15AT]RHP10744.1 stage III sporulation protein AF [Dorea sp. AF36-15AT]
MKKQSSYGRILLVRISMLAMTVIAALWWQEKTESMGIVYASETEDVQISDKTQNMELLESMDFTDIDRMMEDLFPQERMEFADAVRQIMIGNTDVGRDAIKEMLRERILGAWEVNRKSILYLILLAIASAVFIGFSDIFQTRQVSQISFYMIYLLVMGICLASFQAASEWMANGVHTLTGFMKVLYPVYFAAVTVAKGSISSLAFYHLAIILIVVIEELLLHLIVPGIHMYVIIRVMNSLQSEDYLSKFAELLETAIGWGLKTLMGGMIGLNVIQGMLGPAIDTVKRSAVTRGMEMVPGVGDLLGGTAEVALGTAVLIKNSIGIVGMFLCLVLCLAPLLQLAMITLGYKLAAALVQPVSDKRIIECISGVGEGCKMLMNCIFVTGILFLVTVAIVTYTTGM